MSNEEPSQNSESSESNNYQDDYSVKQKVSPTPKSELDFNMMTTDTVYGQPFISKDLRDRLIKEHTVWEDGKPILKQSGYWEIHSYFTRDLRLGNLSDGKYFWQVNEMALARYHLDLAGDYLTYSNAYLHKGFTEPFLVHMRRVAGLIELSHSKNGWFRSRAGTYREERMPIKSAEEKKNWFGMGKQPQEEGQQ